MIVTSLKNKKNRSVGIVKILDSVWNSPKNTNPITLSSWIWYIGQYFVLQELVPNSWKAPTGLIMDEKKWQSE